jgi:hypothetical protein
MDFNGVAFGNRVIAHGKIVLLSEKHFMVTIFTEKALEFW